MVPLDGQNDERIEDVKGARDETDIRFTPVAHSAVAAGQPLLHLLIRARSVGHLADAFGVGWATGRSLPVARRGLSQLQGGMCTIWSLSSRNDSGGATPLSFRI